MLSSLRQKLRIQLLKLLNKLLPKYEQAIILGGNHVEANAFEVADYIGQYETMPVYYAVSKELTGNMPAELSGRVNLIKRGSVSFYIKYMTSRYVFFTHSNSLLSTVSNRQIAVNVWHGILYKRIRRLLGEAPLPAHITVGTSDLTRKMFADAFGVSEGSVTTSGYPRNDIMLRSKENKIELFQRIDEKLKTFDKIIIWLPTFRKCTTNDRFDGREVGNAFYINDFDARRFNRLLKKYNALCYLKPHPAALEYQEPEGGTNFQFITDNWLTTHGITLYHLLGCSDILISDVSSVIIDYLLMDKPVVCISEDFEAYRQTRGFYFEDIENWIPAKIIRDQTDFLHYLERLLNKGTDPFEEKRKDLKSKFFKYHDAQSSRRLLEQLFK